MSVFFRAIGDQKDSIRGSKRGDLLPLSWGFDGGVSLLVDRKILGSPYGLRVSGDARFLKFAKLDLL